MLGAWNAKPKQIHRKLANDRLKEAGLTEHSKEIKKTNKAREGCGSKHAGMEGNYARPHVPISWKRNRDVAKP